jgi:heme o synthase
VGNYREDNMELSSILRPVLRDYSLLVKMRLTLTVVFSSIMAYLLSSDLSHLFLGDIIILSIGGFTITATANILNEVIEKDFDKLMTRTMDRPLATGRMNTSSAVLVAGIHAMVGLFALAYFNPLTVLLGVLAIILYAFVYTPLKRYSTIAITVGAIPGALPVLIGSVAYTGSFSQLGLILFGLQFLWQFPHFWAIGWLGHNEYAKAGYKLCPTDRMGQPDDKIGFYSSIYALLLIPMSFLLWTEGYNSLASVILVCLFSLVFAYYGYQLYLHNGRKNALGLMFSSLIYLPLVLLILFFDKLF